jgi:hypothetical protein
MTAAYDRMVGYEIRYVCILSTLGSFSLSKPSAWLKLMAQFVSTSILTAHDLLCHPDIKEGMGTPVDYMSR